MKKEVGSLFCVFALLGFTTAAFAGAYGEKEEAEELPASPPAAVAAAPAEEPEDFGAAGAYVELGGVYVVENFGDSSNSVGSDYGDSGGYQLRAGYRINSWVAVEGEWEHDINFQDNLEASTYDLTVNGKFYPLTSRIQPYALVGMGWINGLNDSTTREDQNSLGFRFGLGVDAYITKSIGVALEAGYVLPVSGYLSSNDFDTIPISLSAFYRFF